MVAPSRSRQLLLSVVLLSILGPGAALAQPATFSDVPEGHWAFPYVEALAAAGITTGCGPGIYCPDQAVRRTELAVFLLRVVHGADFVPTALSSPELSDLAESHWAYPWAQASILESLLDPCGLTPGLSFCPEDPVSRAEMATRLLVLKYGESLELPVVTSPPFEDVPVDHWAAPHIQLLFTDEITTGCTPTLYCPDAPVTRAELAAFLVRAFNLPIPLGEL
jgi:hypothetical protein